MNKRFLIFFLSVLCLSASAGAQEGISGVLSFHQAIEKALENNYDISILKVELAQSEANNTIGNAGMLPEINAVGGLNKNFSNTTMKLGNGETVETPNAQSTALSGAVQLNWTLFDGMNMFIKKRRLEEMQTGSEIALRQQIQNTLAAVITAYADVVRQKQVLVAIDTSLSLAKVRMDIAEKKFEIGTSDKTDYLQAKVDYNAGRSRFLTQEASLREAKDSLMIIINEDQFSQFDVEDSLYLNKDLKFIDKEEWINNNFSMQLAQQEKIISEYDYKSASAAQWPLLNLSAAYNYNRAENATGYALFNRAYGPQVGLNLHFPIFNGFNIQREKKIARLEVFRNDLLVYRMGLSLSGKYRSVWRSYQNALQSLDLEQENIKYARENLKIQQARFRVGLSSTLELREAEISYVEGLTRLVEMAYALKVSETQLLKLENKLLR